MTPLIYDDREHRYVSPAERRSKRRARWALWLAVLSVVLLGVAL